jgi:hypothetical protein
MDDVLVGILIIAIGAVFCFRGYLAMRIVLPVWGLFAGFAFGAGLIAAITGDGFLGTVLGWISGAFFALVFAALAYLYYEVAITISLAMAGFVITGGILTAIGISASWFVFLVGLAVGVVVGIAVIRFELPMLLLVVLTAMSGAVAMVAGVLLVFNRIDLEQLGTTATTELLDDRPLWTVVAIVLAVVGLVAQLAWLSRVEQDMATQWEAAGGRRLAS